MADIKKILESFDSMSKAEKKSSGPKFPGYWKGTDSAKKSRSRVVGNEESVIKELHDTANSTEYRLREAFNRFLKNDDSTLKVYDTKTGGSTFTEPNKPAVATPATTAPSNASTDSTLKVYNTKTGGSTFTEPNKPAVATPAVTPTTPAYTGIDPVVRQRMGMQPANQDEIRTYLDKNPPFVTSGDGQPIRSGTGSPVVSGGLTRVGRAADEVSPDRERAEAMPRPTQITPRPPITSQPAGVAVTPVPDRSTTKPVTLAPATAAVKPTATKPTATIPQMPKNPAAGSWQDVWKNNPQLKNPNMIQVGQQITMPNGVKVTVNKGDTLGKLAKQYRLGDFNVDESIEQEKIADRYDPDDFDDMVNRVRKLAHRQEKKNGPVDISKLAQRLRDIEKREPVKEYDNAQDPNAQVTSPSDPRPSTASQQSQQQQNMKDQAVDMATAKSTTTTLKNVLGPQFDPNAAATGIVKANDGKPMTPQEQQAMGSMTPLVMKAAQTPSVSGQLKSALQNAGLAAKLGK